MNNRELATFILLAAFVVLISLNKGVRESFGQIARTIRSPKLLIPLMAYVVWTALVVWVAAASSVVDL